MITHNGKPAIAKAVSHSQVFGQRDPGIARKARNFAGAMKRAARAVVKGQKVVVSAEEATRRQAICAGCEFFTGKTCRKCGCIVKFKAALETEHCPIGKW